MKCIRVFLFVLSLTVASEARAEAEGPDYWAVQGVAADDVLNIRTKPSAQGKKVGAIPPGGRQIRNLGCVGEMNFEEYQRLSEAQREKRKRDRWCNVEYKGVTGYVKGVFLVEDSGPPPSHVTGGSVPVSTSDGNLKSECTGAAAGQYGVRPNYVKVNPVKREGDGYSISGTVDQGSDGIKKFKCIYSQNRKLKTVMALTSDSD